MSTEQFDNKIKRALENQSPAFDKKAWDKMEALLDKHLPVKKDKDRKLFFLLFLFLIAGGGSYLYLKSNSENRQPVAIAEKSVSTSASTEEMNKNKSPERILSKTNADILIKEQPVSNAGTREPSIKQNKKSSDQLPGPDKNANRNQNKFLPGKKQNSKPVTTQQENMLAVENGKSVGIATVDEQSTSNPPANSNTESSKKMDADTATQNQPAVAEVIAPEEKKKQEESVADKKTIAAKQKNQSSILNNFFVSASAGMDVSMVQISEIGDLKFLYGAGIGYNISKRFAVRTGFYVTDKVYSSSPEYYHPPNAFWNYYPNMKQVDANCRVYEVPVVVDYSFGFKKDHSWFASAGLSSLFMKKEEYKYYYKTLVTQQDTVRTRVYENQNKHYFSVLSLSGGYTAKLSDQFSLRAEPYFKIALTGIGYGNVKLNSGGLLVSAIYRPFNPSKPKRSH